MLQESSATTDIKVLQESSATTDIKVLRSLKIRGEENFASRKVCVKQYDKPQFFSSDDLPASGLGDFRL